VSWVLRLRRKTGAVTPRPRGGSNFSSIQGKVAAELNRFCGQDVGCNGAELLQTLIERTCVVTIGVVMQQALSAAPVGSSAISVRMDHGNNAYASNKT